MNQNQNGTSYGFPTKKKNARSSRSVVLLASMFMLALQLVSGAANAVNIPILNFLTTQPTKTATTVCVVDGYFASNWTTGTGYWEYDLNTVGYTGPITMTFKNTKSSAPGPTTGIVTYNIAGTDVAVDTFAVTTGCVTQVVTLPAVCSGVSNLIVRVKMSGATASTATHRITAVNVFDAASATCSATPVGGTVSSATTICAGTSTTLSLVGATAGAGISYQWQQSTTNLPGSYTDISGATSMIFTTPALTTSTYYQVKTTCTGFGSALTTPVLVTVTTVAVSGITGYTAPLLVGGTQALADATTGGVWSSSDATVASVDASGHITGVFGGNAVISYKKTVGGCTGTASINVSVVWPNTLALYEGQNGNSLNVMNVTGDTTSLLTATGFGSNTLCGSGGLSGMTVNQAITSYSAGNPHVGYTVKAKSGNVLNMYRIHARARSSSTGPKKAVIVYYAYQGGSASPIVSTTQTLVSGNCGASANDWDFNTGIAVNPNPTETGMDSIQVYVYPFAADTATGTFQLNSLEVYGVVTPNTLCNTGVVTTADSVFPAIATICDTGSRFLTYNIGTGGVTGFGISYQWQVSSNPTSGFSNILNATGAVYHTATYDADTVTVDTLYFRVAVACATDPTNPSFSTVSMLVIRPATANAGTITGGIASTDAPFKHMLIPTTGTFSSSIPGGTWSSNDTSVISINATSGLATPHIPGDAIITYRNTIGGCFATSKDTIIAYYPNTKLAYIGRNGNSTNVYAASDVLTDGVLFLDNWDSATACSSGGYSGLVNSDASFNVLTNGIASITAVGASSFTASDIYATVRQQASLLNDFRVRLAYSLDGGSNWTFSSESTVDHDDCGYSHSVIHFAFPSAITVNTTDPVIFAAFGYHGNGIASTLQINTLSVIGTGASLMKGTGVGNFENNVANIQLYPNPVENVLNIDATQSVNVVIMSIDGKKLLEQKNATSVNVSSLMSGMYLIQVYGNNNTLLKTGKFVKK